MALHDKTLPICFLERNIAGCHSEVLLSQGTLNTQDLISGGLGGYRGENKIGWGLITSSWGCISHRANAKYVMM